MKLLVLSSISFVLAGALYFAAPQALSSNSFDSNSYSNQPSLYSSAEQSGSALTLASSNQSDAVDAGSYPTLGAHLADWVDPVEPFSTKNIESVKRSEGVRYKLVDHQRLGVKESPPERFYALETQLLTPRAVANESTIQIQYNPEYQNLSVHKVLIKRGNKIINALPYAMHQTLDREPELDSLIITGGRELVLTLRDVQAGDSLYYSYTVKGTNPIYNGLREFVVAANYGVAIDKINARIVVNKDDKMNIRRINVDERPEFTVGEHYAEYRYVFEGAAELYSENDAPDWYSPRGYVVFSDMSSWQDVLDWEMPMYAAAVDTEGAVADVAKSIMRRNFTDESRIGAALSWAQDKIRYFGIETGVNTHKPRNANLVIERGFGDCKDKTVLLVSLLNHMGIEASPALVHTDATTLDPNDPLRLHAFNHVIAHVNIDGEDHWLDPTGTGQQGRLGTFSEPDYGRALILSEGQNQLTDMSNPMSGIEKSVTNSFTVGAEIDSSATMKVKTVNKGRSAEYTRKDFEDEAKSSIAEGYIDYYRDYFGEISITKPLWIKNQKNNRTTVVENYTLDSLWSIDSDDNLYQWFYAHELQSTLDTPSNPDRRTDPFDIPYPLEKTEAVVLHLDSVPTNENSWDELDTPWFHLETTYEQSTLADFVKTTWVLKTKKQTVTPDEAQAYTEAVDELNDQLSVYLTPQGYYYSDSSDEEDESEAEESAEFEETASVESAQ